MEIITALDHRLSHHIENSYYIIHIYIFHSPLVTTVYYIHIHTSLAHITTFWLIV